PEVLRSVGKEMMLRPESAGGANRSDIGGLYPVCNAISSLKYENRESVGHIVFARPNHPDVDIELELESPFLLDDYRAVRKLLQLTSPEISLLSDSLRVFGLG